jgi:small subunit ribosomal protein S7
MRGSKKTPKRKIAPDPKFGSVKIAKFINYIMRRGKKATAQKIVYNSFRLISDKTKSDPMEIFEKAIKNVAPSLEVKGRRIGGANYQIPVVVSSERKLILAFRWIIESAKTKHGKPMTERLANEILAASKGEGDAIKKREDTHRMAEANRAFAHFA